jgi:hypothetical protein
MLSTPLAQHPRNRDIDIPRFDEVVVDTAPRCTCTASTAESEPWPSAPEAPEERTGFADCSPLERTDTWDHENGHRVEEF